MSDEVGIWRGIFRHDRATRHRRVVEAAKLLIHYGEHCSQGYRGPCEHCEAWDGLEAAVKGLSPVDQFIEPRTTLRQPVNAVGTMLEQK